MIYLDEDYQMAVVGEPDGRFGWILSRVKEPSSAQLDAAKAALVENGYRLDPLIMVRQ